MRLAYQLFVVGYPGDEVHQLVVVDGPGPDQLLGELIHAPGQQQHPT